MIQVFIADDHAVVRRGLKEIIAETADMIVTGEAGNAQEILEKIQSCPRDVLVLDLTMPGRNGLDVLSEIKHTYPKLPVLILSMHPEEQFGIRALKAGASGYLSKASAPSELVNAIRKVYSGGRYVSPALAENLALGLHTQNDKPLHTALSNRELQVMQMMAVGRKIKQIGEELSLSVKTVNTYRTRILEKMQMKTNAEIIRYSIEQELVE